MRRYRTKTLRSHGNTAEVPLALYIMFLFVTLPLIDLGAVTLGAAVTYLSAHQTASRAAVQQNYAKALAGVDEEAQAFLQSSLSNFLKLRPVGGYQRKGVDLYITSTNVQTGQTSQFGPNQPVPPPIDTATNIFECSTKATYEVGPLISFDGLDCLRGVPGLGKPAVFSFTAHRMAEYPQGLATSNNNLQNQSSSLGLLFPDWGRGVELPPPPTALSEPQWNNPSIFNQIAGAGQTVMEVNVLEVYANNPNWTETHCNIGPNQKVWVDFRADGKWAVEPIGDISDPHRFDHLFRDWADQTTAQQWRESMANAGWYDADGWVFGIMQNDGSIKPFVADNGFAIGKLVGRCGDGEIFGVGKQLKNFTPPNAGPVKLICNEDSRSPYNHANNVGKVIVRIIVTE